MPRVPEFDYQLANKLGKPTENVEAISKVIATLKQSTAGYATKLGKELEDLLRTKEEVDKKIEDMKADIRPFVAELFDAKDDVFTRVVETAKVVITLGRAETRAAFNKEKFLKSIATEFPQLVKRFDEISVECTNVSNISAKLSVGLKNEGIGDAIKNLFNKVKNEVSKIVKGIKNYLVGYDRKLEEWNSIIEKNMIERTAKIDRGEEVAFESFKQFYYKELI
jgi:phage-related protein